ncbi:MAG: LysM peptidoglycan-binding domain-containing protein [Planctomycetota bacterium]|nr:LysM peptidoglycan-binding domain-containing protein [Planctomycetota bacterium]
MSDGDLSDDSLLAAAENLLSSTDGLIAENGNDAARKNPGFGFQFETAVTSRTTSHVADRHQVDQHSADRHENGRHTDDSYQDTEDATQSDGSASIESSDEISGASAAVETPEGDSTPNKTDDEDWGFSSRRSGMARETKIGMALILLLLGAFGFVVYRKTNEQTVLNIDGITADSKTKQLAGKSVVPKEDASTVNPHPHPHEHGIPHQTEPPAVVGGPQPTGVIQPIGFDQSKVPNGATGVQTLPTRVEAANTPVAGSMENPFGQLPAGQSPGTARPIEPAATGQSNGQGLNEFNPFATPGSSTPANQPAHVLQPVEQPRTVSLDDPNLVPFEQNTIPERTPPGELTDAFQQPIERGNSGEVRQPVHVVSSNTASTQVHPLFEENGPTTNPNSAATPLANTDAFAQNGNAFKFEDGSKTPAAGNTTTPAGAAELDALLERNRPATPANGEPRIIRETTMPIEGQANTGDPGFSADPIRPVQPLDALRPVSPPVTGTFRAEPQEFTLDRTGAANADPRARARVHVVDVGENFWTISRKYYQTGRYNQALGAYNSTRIPDARKMRPAMKVLIPPVATLHAKYPKLCPSDLGNTVAGVSQERPGFFIDSDGNPAYRAGASDTLGAIAQQHLGRASRWIQIYKLNQSHVKNPDKLPIGTVLRLPADASNVRIVGRGQNNR